MNKGEMKKYIPKGVYCYNKKGKCKWYKFLGIKKWNKTNCEFSDDCKSCEECETHIVKCEYLDLIDDKDETLLWDSCKECGVNNELDED